MCLALPAQDKKTSGDFTFSTSAPPDITPPIISDVFTSGFDLHTKTIVWKTNEASDSQVEYGTTASYGSATALDPSMVTSHSQLLTGLAAGGTYHYRVHSRDAAGNLASSDDMTFGTGEGGEPPVICAVSISGITSTTAIIAWTTNEASDSQVQYGIAMSYGSSTTVDSTLVTSHAQMLVSLTVNTKYHFRVRSRDAEGNLAVSGDFVFTNAGSPPHIPALASAIQASNIAARTATVSWITDVPTDSQVFYGTSPDCPLSTILNADLSISHAVDLRDLRSNTIYYYRMQFRTAAGILASSETGSFQTTSYQSLSLVVPRLQTKPFQSAGTDRSEMTGIAVANLADVDTVLTFTAYDTTGAKISGTGITNPTSRTLAPGAQIPILDFQLFGDSLLQVQPVGWIAIDSSTDAVTCFSLIFNASLSMMDGAPVSSTMTTQAVFTEIEGDGFTDIHVVNPNGGPANVIFNLRQADGTIRESAIRRIDSQGSVAEPLNTLFAGRYAASDYVEVLSDVGIVPFQLLGKTPDYLEALNGQTTSASASTLYCPQYVVGGPYRSTLSITNLNRFKGMLTLRFYLDNGTQIGPARTLPIAAHGKVYISDQSFFVSPEGGMLQGYVEIATNGVRVVGSVVFSDPLRSTFATALPLVAQLQRTMVFSQVASDPTNFTGLAILNPNDATAVARLELFREDGVTNASARITIPARQRISQVLPQIFLTLQRLNRTSGYIRITVDQGVAAFSVYGTNDLKTLSAVPPQIIR